MVEHKHASGSCNAHLCLLFGGHFLAMAALLCAAAVTYDDDHGVVMQMYLYVGNWKFKVMERKEVERQAVALRMTALDGHGKPHGQPNSPQNGSSQHDTNTVHDLENGAPFWSVLLHTCLTCAAHARHT